MRIGGLDVLFDSLSRQNYMKFEVILVDGIYRYRHKEVIEQVRRGGYLRDFSFRHIEPLGNKFPRFALSRAINTGLVAAHGDIILQSYDNCWFPNDWVRKHAEFHEEHPEESAAAVSGDKRYSMPRLHKDVPHYKKETPADSAKYLKDLDCGILNRYMWSVLEGDWEGDPQDILPLDPAHGLECAVMQQPVGPIQPRWVCGKNDSYKLRMALEVNGWDEAYDGYRPFHDTDFGWRTHHQAKVQWYRIDNWMRMLFYHDYLPSAIPHDTWNRNEAYFKSRAAQGFMGSVNSWDLSITRGNR